VIGCENLITVKLFSKTVKVSQEANRKWVQVSYRVVLYLALFPRYLELRSARKTWFLADRTNGRAYATVLRP